MRRRCSVFVRRLPFHHLKACIFLEQGTVCALVLKLSGLPRLGKARMASSSLILIIQIQVRNFSRVGQGKLSYYVAMKVRRAIPCCILALSTDSPINKTLREPLVDWPDIVMTVEFCGRGLWVGVRGLNLRRHCLLRGLRTLRKPP